jgi:hypothetical protein
MSNTFRVKKLAAVLHDLEIPQGPTIDQLTLMTGTTEVTGDPFSLDMKDAAEIEAFFSLANLEAFLDQLSPGGLQGFSADEENGELRIKAQAKVIVNIPISALCELVIMNGSEIWVELKDVEVMGGSAAKLVEGLIEKINPIFSASDLPFPAELQSVSVGETGVTATGHVPAGAWD